MKIMTTMIMIMVMILIPMLTDCGYSDSSFVDNLSLKRRNTMWSMRCMTTVTTIEKTLVLLLLLLFITTTVMTTVQADSYS